MKKFHIYIALCSVFFIIILFGIVYVKNFSSNDTTVVEIIQDDVVLQKIDLAQVEKKQILTVEYQGRKNIIEIDKGKIRIMEAQCPDKICVKKGYLVKDGLPIVCLPNHLFIRYVDNDGKMDSATD